MIHEIGNRLLDRMDKKFGKLAIPGILRWIATFQFAVWGIALMTPNLLKTLDIDPAAVFGKWEIWRVISWIFTPVSFGGWSFIAVIFAFFIYRLISDALEQEWGVFRTNLYVLTVFAFMSIIALIPWMRGGGMLFSQHFFSIMFLSFATLHPNFVLNLWGIIPVKSKWLGLVSVALMVAMVLQSTVAIIYIAASLIPYFIVFIPTTIRNAKLRGENAIRKAKFQQGVPGDSEAFNTCESCGKTDVSDPELTFRVTAEGKELCENCLPQKTNE